MLLSDFFLLSALGFELAAAAAELELVLDCCAQAEPLATLADVFLAIFLSGIAFCTKPLLLVSGGGEVNEVEGDDGDDDEDDDEHLDVEEEQVEAEEDGEDANEIVDDLWSVGSFVVVVVGLQVAPIVVT